MDFTNKLFAVFLNNCFCSKVKILLSYDKLAIKILFLLLRHTWTSIHIKLLYLLIYLLNLSFIIIIIIIVVKILPKPFSFFSCQALLVRPLVLSLRPSCCCCYSSSQTSWFCDGIQCPEGLQSLHLNVVSGSSPVSQLCIKERSGYLPAIFLHILVSGCTETVCWVWNKLGGI